MFDELKKENFKEFIAILNSRYENSEASVANMYMWQHYYNTKFCIINNIIYSIYDMHGDAQTEAFMPYGANRNSCETTDFLLSYFEENFNRYPTINLATEDYLNFLLRAGKYNIRYEEVRNSFDYVYNTKDLIDLSGRKYHAKKNHYNAFVKKHNIEYKRYNSEMYDQCIEFCSNVVKQRTKDNEKVYHSEMKSIINAFDAYDLLNLICSLIIIDDKIVALSLGERLTDNYALIHIEKAAYDYRDAYPVINRLALKNEFSDLEFVNREEDLGIPGLRKAKKSYHPCRMIKKYKIEFIK